MVVNVFGTVENSESGQKKIVKPYKRLVRLLRLITVVSLQVTQG